MITLPGVDLSSYNGPPGQWRGPAGSIAWAAVKFTEFSAAGLYASPDALADWAALKAAGHARVAYLFGHPSASAARSVSDFLGMLRPVLADDDGIALDLEVSDGLPAAEVAAWGLSVLRQLERETGRRPYLYTFPNFAAAGNCAGMESFPLWIADPSSPAGRPMVPGPWKTWSIHQFAITAGIDRDAAAYPSLAAMRTAMGKPAPKPQPAPVPTLRPEDTMLLNRGKNAVTPIVLAPGDKTLYLLGATPGAEVIVHFGGQSPETAMELYFKNGAHAFPVPAGCTGAEITRVDGGSNDVGWRVA